MSRFSKPKKKFTPSTRTFGNESLERQVLSSSTVRSGGNKSGAWSWKDSYGNDQFIPQDPIIIASSFYVTVYEQVNLFVTDGTGENNEYFVLDEEGNPENYILWTDNEIGSEGFFVLNDNGEPEEFQTYD